MLIVFGQEWSSRITHIILLWNSIKKQYQKKTKLPYPEQKWPQKTRSQTGTMMQRQRNGKNEEKKKDSDEADGGG